MRLASLTGLISTRPPDARALDHSDPARPGDLGQGRVLVTTSTKQGSPYAAVMATGGHGVRFQYDYTHDQTGPPGQSSPATRRAGCA